MNLEKNSVYIIESDSIFSLWLSAMLENDSEHSFQNYVSAEEAYQDIREFSPLNVIVDNSKGKECDSQNIILNIKSISPSTKVIVLSNNDDANAAVDLLRTGADSFVTKDKDLIKNLISSLI